MSARTLVVLALVALLAAAPWIGYGVGLVVVEGRPAPPAASRLTAEQAEALHVWLRKAGVLDVAPLSPWQYAIDLVREPQALESGGLAAARVVARDHVARRLKLRGARWRRLAEVALTIWLTRNWTSDAILARAYEIAQARGGRGG
jgi:hypothetical protein